MSVEILRDHVCDTLIRKEISSADGGLKNDVVSWIDATGSERVCGSVGATGEGGCECSENGIPQSVSKAIEISTGVAIKTTAMTATVEEQGYENEETSIDDEAALIDLSSGLLSRLRSRLRFSCARSAAVAIRDDGRAERASALLLEKHRHVRRRRASGASMNRGEEGEREEEVETRMLIARLRERNDIIQQKIHAKPPPGGDQMMRGGEGDTARSSSRVSFIDNSAAAAAAAVGRGVGVGERAVFDAPFKKASTNSRGSSSGTVAVIIMDYDGCGDIASSTNPRLEPDTGDRYSSCPFAPTRGDEFPLLRRAFDKISRERLRTIVACGSARQGARSDVKNMNKNSNGRALGREGGIESIAKRRGWDLNPSTLSDFDNLDSYLEHITRQGLPVGFGAGWNKPHTSEVEWWSGNYDPEDVKQMLVTHVVDSLGALKIGAGGIVGVSSRVERVDVFFFDDKPELLSYVRKTFRPPAHWTIPLDLYTVHFQPKAITRSVGVSMKRLMLLRSADEVEDADHEDIYRRLYEENAEKSPLIALPAAATRKDTKAIRLSIRTPMPHEARAH